MAPALIREINDEPVSSPAIELNETESTLRTLFIDVAQYIQETSPTHEPIILRFTGGWVRDKLLGVPSHDIDVAINNMTGLQFGQRMLEYLQVPGNPEKYGLDGVATTEKQDQSAAKADKTKTVRGLHKIAANPEKSKHLETVATSVLGVDIDLVNLRKEVYDEDSRNPQMDFGTPEEDALRRDATVNAMFYNINTQQLEDLTMHGLSDMKRKILRTPMEPYQTFMDDPLRVLRLIRFASRLGWSIEDSARQAMQRPDIQISLKKKISRERVGIELEKALRGPDPHEALRLILELGLYETIFSDPTNETHTEHVPRLENLDTVIDDLEFILNNTGSLRTFAVRDNDDQYLAWQLAALIPYRDAPLPGPIQPGRKAPPPIASQVAREGIKATSKTCELVTASIRHLEDIRSLVHAVYEEKRKHVDNSTPIFTARDHLGMKIRTWGANWRNQFMFALLADIADNPEQTELHLRKYTTFIELLHKLDILDAYQLKPLLDGKSLAKALGTSPGPWMKDALDVVMAWQLRNPGQTDAQEAIEEVKRTQQGELAISLADHFLRLTIRPLFVRSKPHNITEQARKRAYNEKIASTSTLDDEKKPWKDATNTYALDLLHWVTRSLDAQSVQRLWPLLLPPVLALIDDWETRFKSLGAELLGEILLVTPPDLLRRTGLAPIFEDTLIPCLTYLPPLTEQSQSLELLPVVYRALMTLAKVRPPLPVTDLNQLSAEEILALDTIVRKGIIYGFTHSGQNAAIMTMLLNSLVQLINRLGIDFVKHLKFVLPMLNEVLSNKALPTHRPELLRSAVAATQAVIRNCWPRMVVHRGEILRGLTICWLNMEDDGTDGVGALKHDMKICVNMLREAIGDQIDLDADIGVLVDADARLGELLMRDQFDQS